MQGPCIAGILPQLHHSTGPRLAVHARKPCQAHRGHRVIQASHQFVNRRRVVANQNHVAARGKSSLGAGDDTARNTRCFHAEIVAENHAAEPELSAQHLLQPNLREPGRPVVDAGVDHVRRHDAPDARVDQALERHQVHRFDFFERAAVHRDFDVGIGPDMPVPGKVLADPVHSGLLEPLHQGARQFRDRARVGM